MFPGNNEPFLSLGGRFASKGVTWAFVTHPYLLLGTASTRWDGLLCRGTGSGPWWSPAACHVVGNLCRCTGRSPRQGCPGLPPKVSEPFDSPAGSNLRPTLGAGAVLSFFPETNKTCFSILLGLKYLSLFSQGRRRTPEASRRKEIITGPYRSRSCATAAHSLRGRNIGPQTWNTRLSKCLRTAQEKHPPETYLITMICNRLNVCLSFLRTLHLLPRAHETLKPNAEKFNEGDLIVCVKANMPH